MILMAAVDDNKGMTFNARRQSQDRMMREKMVSMAASPIHMNAYSAKLFQGYDACVSEDFLDTAGSGDYCFVENCSVKPYEDAVECIILFKWNRVYPAGTYFDIDLNSWQCVSKDEFAGSSHEKITVETYVKKEEI